ncbi:hypothetical protein MLD38_031690 [Melastoma candidum]|uniref:Uncharacterized protein n=1 Tax=Melastoma candidum TaxID=119954 RepID=A0ACB9MPX1_9MYRT|nr:hypothetical protein MLD38_031690 [Melastoma candidum]
MVAKKKNGKAPGSKRSYEECRRERVEENKKRMEQLNLGALVKALSPSPKPSTAKANVMRKQFDSSAAPIRRSTRVASLPAPNYKEIHDIDPSERVRRGSYSRRDLLNRVYASDSVRRYAIDRAERLISDLEGDFPSFIKPMLQSHVTGGFWLSLPFPFCNEHLPHSDEAVTLVDEEEEEFSTKYLIQKNGLSGGWRGFAIAHDLVDGDALVFQLIKPLVFKVYIVKAYIQEEQDDKGREAKEEEKEKDSNVSHLDRNTKRVRASKKK